MKRYIFFLLCFYVIQAEKPLPVHQIIEIDDAAYLVQMMQDADQKISYRTYPFGAINAPGFYKLANQVSSSISINSSDVMLDLGGQNVSGGIVVQTNLENITIKDGTVDVQNAVTDAVKVNSGCQNVTLKNLLVKNATDNGIFFDRVTESCIANCEMTSNVTGIAINQSRNIVIENCTASKNRNEGFCLMQSTTCYFKNCKALGTGEGNASSTQDIFGFVATSGHGNIFERCIANGTKGSTVTNSNSIVTGFMLKGSESGTRIINCESAHATTAPDGLAIPYGMYLQGTISNPITFSTGNAIPTPSGAIVSLDWSPDGRYVVSADAARALTIFQLDRDTQLLSQVARRIDATATLRSASWCLDGIHIASGGDDDFLRVYRFSSDTNNLTLLGSINAGADVNSVHWRFDRKFILVGTDLQTRVYSFDPTSGRISLFANADVSVPTLTAQWSPDGAYAITGHPLANDPEVRLLLFNQASATLIQVATNNAPTGNVNTLRWSSDGQYVLWAAGGGGSNRCRICFINRSLNTIVGPVASTDPGVGISSASWSPDGKYIVIGTSSAAPTRILQFNRTANSLTTAVQTALGSATSTGITAWSPDGGYIVSTQQNAAPIHLFPSIISFPSKNILKNNTVYCNSSLMITGTSPRGGGISGSSVTNLIIDNTSYTNPINPIVENNYEFVTNVFNQIFQDYPTKNQNLGPFLRKPIGAPPDQIALLNLLTSKLCDIQTKIELLIAANS